MNDYIFKTPRDCPALDFASLSAWMGTRHRRTIGTTVTVAYEPETAVEPVQPAAFVITLYGTRIAVVRPHEVGFPGPDDPHMATTEWIGQVVRDNAISGRVGRVRRRKADGPGPQMARGRAGLLCIGSRDKPVFGHAYPVGDIAGMRQRQAEWEARWAVQRAEYAEESRRIEALKVFEHPVLGPLYAVTWNSHGYDWEVADATFATRLGFIRDSRQDAAPWPTASPANTDAESAPFWVFTGDTPFRGEVLGPFTAIADALSALGDHAAREKAGT